ncbi:hypothetical protein Tco_0550972 [Tanacetum coccineum]
MDSPIDESDLGSLSHRRTSLEVEREGNRKGSPSLCLLLAAFLVHPALRRLQIQLQAFTIRIFPSSKESEGERTVLFITLKQFENIDQERIYERPITELVEFIRAHQPVSFVPVFIDNSLRFVVCSVWSSVGDVGPECLWLSDIELLLVAFDSQLKAFHPLKNDNTSGKHP